jgi:hypothetical protein
MEGERRVSGTRLLFRFGIGATELAGRRMITALQAVDGVLSSAATEPEPDGALGLRHALLGAMAALPAWARAALARHGTAARSLREGVAGGHRLASRLPGARLARRRYDTFLARIEAQLVRWSLAGRREEAAGRALAGETIGLATQELVSIIADSPELKRVIAEQSESMGASAMADLREGSVRADTLAERVARRFVRRSR